MIAITRTLTLLNVLSRHPQGCTFSMLQELCGDVPAPTLSRLLKVLVREGAVEKDVVRGGYCLGPSMVRLARSIVGGHTPDRVVPVLEALAERTGQSAAYFEYSDDRSSLVLVAKHEMPESFHYIPVLARTGPLDNHAFGQVLLAWGDDAAGDALGDVSATQRNAFLEKLTTIRAAGMFDGLCGSHDSLFRIVAPVFTGTGGDVCGAIGITVVGSAPDEKIRNEMRAQVSWAAQEATSTLSGLNYWCLYRKDL